MRSRKIIKNTTYFLLDPVDKPRDDNLYL
ncbi:MAG TPA: palindromic element RPE4 domain-containing protein [Rickettsia endosymbiont of Columbicola hoogstraali]|nr:palindromic element RPE4 domain-containing protein [Rickettsia endosymbiont of Columbicola hoogstraali]